MSTPAGPRSGRAQRAGPVVSAPGDARSKEMTMMLEEKIAVIHGGGGAVGGAVARAFAAAGARVYLTGRTMVRLEKVAADIGHAAAVAEVDALDERAVAEHADAVVA